MLVFLPPFNLYFPSSNQRAWELSGRKEKGSKEKWDYENENTATTINPEEREKGTSQQP